MQYLLVLFLWTKNKNIIIYGGKGIVGGISAIMCAQNGAKCTIVGYDGIKNVMIPSYEPIKTEYDSSIWLNTNYVHEEYVYGNELPDLGGKTVIVGLSASGLSAQISTPQGLHPAHHLQASALQTSAGYFVI